MTVNKVYMARWLYYKHTSEIKLYEIGGAGEEGATLVVVFTNLNNNKKMLLILTVI